MAGEIRLVDVDGLWWAAFIRNAAGTFDRLRVGGAGPEQFGGRPVRRVNDATQTWE